MTDKLHCPYCGEELSNDFGVIFCYNEACKIHGCELNEQVIRDIIDGKKAQDSLKEISRLNQYIRKELAHQIPEEASKADNSIYTITFEIAKECKKGLHNKIEEKSDGR